MPIASLYPGTNQSCLVLLVHISRGHNAAGEQVGNGPYRLMFGLNYALSRGGICTRIVSSEVTVTFATGGYLLATSVSDSSSRSISRPPNPILRKDELGLTSIASFSISSQVGLFLSA